MANTILPKGMRNPVAGTTFTVKLSSKFQFVLPRKMREAMNKHTGQTLYFYTTKDNEVILTTKSPMERAREYFKGKHVWGEDAAELIGRDRDSWREL